MCADLRVHEKHHVNARSSTLVRPLQEGDVVIMDVDPDGAIAVLAGDKKMRSVIDNTPAGIS